MKKIRFCFTLLLSAAVFSAPANAFEHRDEPRVRVLVKENQKLMRVETKGAWSLQLLPSLQTVRQEPRLALCALTSTPNGIKLGDKEWSVRGIRIRPAEDRDLYLDTTRFRGFLDIVKNDAGSLNAVNHIGIENYLYGVLQHEVAYWWPMEALKAQAIAARSYALYQVSVSRPAAYDLKSTTSSQVYGGSTVERGRTKKAVDATRGQILSYRGQVFPAYFHATCGGVTAGAQELWKINLNPIAGGTHCGYCRFSPHYSWKSDVGLSDIEEKMMKNGRPIGQILKIEPVSKTPSGRVGSLRITGTSSEAVIAAKDFRIWVGGDKMRSTNFIVRTEEDVAKFEGKGWGHGVGLCQWGTLGQAMIGRKHRQILQFYYPGSQIGSYES